MTEPTRVEAPSFSSVLQQVQQTSSSNWVAFASSIVKDSSDDVCVVSTIDRSKGCDNLVTQIEVGNSDISKPVIFRMARKPPSLQPHAGHQPIVQAWVNDRFQERRGKGPLTLSVSPSSAWPMWVLETCIGDCDLDECLQWLSRKSLLMIWEHIGAELALFHQILQIPGIHVVGTGTLQSLEPHQDDGWKIVTQQPSSSWAQFFHHDLLLTLQEAVNLNALPEAVLTVMAELWERAKNSIEKRGLGLVHCDISVANIRVSKVSQDLGDSHVDKKPRQAQSTMDFQLAGLIDFSDITVADPLTDFGHILIDQRIDDINLPKSLDLGPTVAALKGWGIQQLHDTDPDVQTVDAIDAALRLYAMWFSAWRTMDRNSTTEQDNGQEQTFTRDARVQQTIIELIMQEKVLKDFEFGKIE